MATDTGISTTRLRQLGDFVRSRRERLAPQIVGLPPRSRRRTPGLRREEVAELAGIGLTWYTWLEQGRDIHVSAQTLTAISRALQLEPVERLHLFRLADRPADQWRADESVRPAQLRVLESWDPYPAYITGRRWDVLACNRSAEAIFEFAELPKGRRNTLWSMFMRPQRRLMFRDWERDARLMVASFRAEASAFLDDPSCRELIDDLCHRSLDFARLWASQDVRGRPEGLKRLRHARLGDLELEHTTYCVNDQPSLKLVLYSAAPGSRTQRALRGLSVDNAPDDVLAAAPRRPEGVNRRAAGSTSR